VENCQVFLYKKGAFAYFCITEGNHNLVNGVIMIWAEFSL